MDTYEVEDPSKTSRDSRLPCKAGPTGPLGILGQRLDVQPLKRPAGWVQRGTACLQMAFRNAVKANLTGTSLVAQWLRIHVVRRTRVQSLVK